MVLKYAYGFVQNILLKGNLPFVMIKYSVLLAVIFKVLGSTTNPRDVGGSERRHSWRAAIHRVD